MTYLNNGLFYDSCLIQDYIYAYIRLLKLPYKGFSGTMKKIVINKLHYNSIIINVNIKIG